MSDSSEHLGERTSFNGIRELFANVQGREYVDAFLNLLERYPALRAAVDEDLSRWQRATAYKEGPQISVAATAALKRKVGLNNLLNEAELQLQAAIQVFKQSIPAEQSEGHTAPHDLRVICLNLSRQMGELITLVQFINTCNSIAHASINTTSLTFVDVCQSLNRGGVVIDADDVAAHTQSTHGAYINTFG